MDEFLKEGWSFSSVEKGNIINHCYTEFISGKLKIYFLSILNTEIIQILIVEILSHGK